MNTHRIITFAALAFGAAAYAGEEKDEKIAFDKLPAAVQKTIQAQATEKGGTVGEVEKESEHGKVSYEADIVAKDGAKFEVEVAEDGTLVKAKADEDKEEKNGKDEEKDDDHDDDKEEK